MTKEIKLCLVYRDMWQSSGKYMPRIDQLQRVAEPIIDMGCFARVETNGGGFEQICLLAGENPNAAVRAWTRAFNKAGIQTQMLERGINALSMNAVGADVRKLMFTVKKKQGTDIARSFDGLNHADNLALSFQYAREAGMVAQGALSITHSPVHTVDYYIQLADRFIELGAQEIAVKDMAGVGRPASIGRMIKGIKERHPKVLLQYHGHATPGFSVASSLEAARAGADIVDVGMEPLSWGTGHADLLTIHAMLKDAGFSLPDVNIKAYMETRQLTQAFVDDFLGYYISPQNRLMNSLLIGPGLPGGMMGSLMADLEKSLNSLNKWLQKEGMQQLTIDELLLRLFEEVQYVWPRLGYPPLVTPYSQYVKNVALVNVIQRAKGRERWSLIDENTWNMILGGSGPLPGKLGAEIVALAEENERIFFTGNPQDLYPDELPKYRELMQNKGWSLGQDEEELLEYALHPREYERYKSGDAKADFEKDLARQRASAGATAAAPAEVATAALAAAQAPRQLTITVDGKAYQVRIDYEQDAAASPDKPMQASAQQPEKAGSTATDSRSANITAPLEGKFLLTRDPADKAIQVGSSVKAGDVVGYIEAMKVMNAITSTQSGTVREIVVRHGQEVNEDDVIITLEVK